MDGQGHAILALEVAPKNPTQKIIIQDSMLAISARKTVPH